MNINANLNKITNYIENHLFEEISNKSLGKLIGMTGYVLNYVWTSVTGMSLSNYIKNRRLTLAYNLLKSNKVIDVAFMCGYNSSQAFSRAYKSFHGFSPSQSRTKNRFSVQCKLMFDEDCVETNVKAQYVTLPQYVFYGEKIHLSYQDNISKKIGFFWQKNLEKYPSIRISAEKYGVVVYCKDGFDYFIALKNTYSLDCQKVDIKANNYIKLEFKNYIASKIDDFANEIKDNYCINQKAPDIEIYHGNDVELYFGIK